MHWAERLATRLGVSLADDPIDLERLDAPDCVMAVLRAAALARVDVHGEFVNAFERRKLQALSADEHTLDLRVVSAPGAFPERLRAHQRFAQLRAFDMTASRARGLAKVLAAETVREWERFRRAG